MKPRGPRSRLAIAHLLTVLLGAWALACSSDLPPPDDHELAPFDFAAWEEDAATGIEAEAEAVTETEPAAEADVPSPLEGEAGWGGEEGNEAVTDADPEPGPDVIAEPEPEPGPEPAPDPEPAPEAVADTDAEPEAEAEAVEPPPFPLSLWNTGLMHNAADLNVEIANEQVSWLNGHGYLVRELTFVSFEWPQGDAEPFSVHAFLVMPQAGPPKKPGVVALTGLSTFATAEEALALADQLDTALVTFDAPGHGLSEGLGPAVQPQVMFAVEPDPRASWFYAYAFAAGRAATLLLSQPEVHSQRVGVVGEELGGVAALILAGVDPRLAAVVARNASGDLVWSAQQGSWWNLLLSSAGLHSASASFVAWGAALDPLHYLPYARAPLLLVVGTQDEYYPLTCALNTFQAVGAPEARLVLIPNWDNHYYASGSGAFETFNNSIQANGVLDGARLAWVRHFLAADPAYPAPPPVPGILRSDVNGASQTGFDVTIEGEAAGASVTAHYSVDGSTTYGKVACAPNGPGAWNATADVPPMVWNDSNMVYLSDLAVPLGPDGAVFHQTSWPHTPPGFVPTIRPMY